MSELRCPKCKSNEEFEVEATGDISQLVKLVDGVQEIIKTEVEYVEGRHFVTCLNCNHREEYEVFTGQLEPRKERRKETRTGKGVTAYMSQGGNKE